MGYWWWLWMGFMFVFFVAPLGYGWGYRSWGMPYPSYLQRRRAQSAGSDLVGGYDHYAWGWGGDMVWMVLLIAVLWAVWACWASVK